MAQALNLLCKMVVFKTMNTPTQLNAAKFAKCRNSCNYVYFNVHATKNCGKLWNLVKMLIKNQYFTRVLLRYLYSYETQKTCIKWIKFCADLNNVSERSAGGPWFESRSRSNQNIFFDFWPRDVCNRGLGSDFVVVDVDTYVKMPGYATEGLKKNM